MKTTKTTRQQRLLLGLAATIGMQAGASAASAPDVPDQVKVPAGERLVFRAHASGAQIYVCQQGADGKSQWTLKAARSAAAQTGRELSSAITTRARRGSIRR